MLTRASSVRNTTTPVEKAQIRHAGRVREARGHLRAFKGIVAGDYDDLPEQAFYMVGTIDEAVTKAKKLAAEAA